MARKVFFFVLAVAVFQMAMNIYLLNREENKDVSSSNHKDDFVSIDKNDRPWMVVHVGPPKTGTTTIQTGLTLNIPRLAQLDNIFFLGQSSSAPKKNPRIEYARFNDDQKGYNNGTLPIYPAKYLFLGNEEMFQTLKDYQKQKHNVVISTEHFTSKFIPGKGKGKFFARIFRNVFLSKNRSGKLSESSGDERGKRNMRKGQSTSSTNHHRHLMDLKKTTGASGKKLTSSLYVDESSHFGFNVKIVVNYRHYFQWLPSYYFQSKLMNQRSDKHSLREYIEEAIGSLKQDYVSHGGDFKNITWLQTIPPGLDKIHGTLWSYMQWSSPVSLRNRVEIFDLHQQQIIINDSENMKQEYSKKSDLFQNFVCQALPAAAETCSRVLEANKTIVARAREESSRVSSLESGKLSDTQLYQLKFAGLAREENFTSTYNFEPAQSVFRFRRFARKVENLIRANFYDWAEQRRDASYKDSHSQLCLSKELTLALKNVSWNMLLHLEALIRIRDKELQEKDSDELNELFMAPEIHRPQHRLLLSPQKYNHDFNNYGEDEDLWATIKRNHDRLFEETVDSGAYCELDLESLLSDENFVRQIFYRTEDISQRKNSREYHK